MASLSLLLSLSVEAGDDGSTTTITAEDIRRENPASVMALLKTRVGLDDRGGTIGIRGIPGVVIRIDGFVSSMLELKQLKPDQIEKIVIVRGASSAEFGAEAMGGAVIVTTWKQDRQSLFEVSQSLTSLGGRATGIRGNHSSGAYDIGASVDETHVGGSKPVQDSPYPYQINVEDEYSDKRQLDGRLEFRTGTGNHKLNIKQLWFESHYGRPNWWEEYSGTTWRLQSSFGGAQDIRVSAGYESYNDKGLRDVGTGTDPAGLAPDRYLLSEGDAWDGEYRRVYRQGEGVTRFELSGGVSSDVYRIEDYATRDVTFRLGTEVRNAAVALFQEGKSGSGFTFQAGGRYDRYWYPDTQIFNAMSDVQRSTGEGVSIGAFNPKLTIRWAGNSGTNVSSSLSTGFVPPSPYQLYYSDVSASSEFIANPDLKSERSFNWDFGVKRSFAVGEWGATLYVTEWRNKIGVAITDYGVPIQRQFRNVGTAASNGIELQARWRPGRQWSVFGNYTYNHTEIVENSVDPGLVGNELPDMPRHKANAGVGYEGGGGVSGRVSIRYIGETFTDENNTTVDEDGFKWRKDAYSVVDFMVVQRFRHGELTFAVDNLMDEQYITGFFRSGQERTVRVEMKLNM